MTSASRGFAGDSDAWQRRSGHSASDASAVSGSIAVAIDEHGFDDAFAEFDRRVVLVNSTASESRNFDLANFSDASGNPFFDQPAEALSHVLQQAGPMPADVAEECVRGMLASLRSAHNRRWSHGRLSLDAFLLDAYGVVRLTGVGSLQRETFLRADEHDDRDGAALDQEEQSDRLWNDAFLIGAAEDFHRLGPQIVAPLLQAIEGESLPSAERLIRCLDGLDGTIASLADVEHAWQTLDACIKSGDACFQTGDGLEAPALSAPAEVKPSEAAEATAVPVVPAEQVAEPLPASSAPRVAGASRVVLFWLCLVGGFAAMAGTLATVIVGR